MADYTSGYLPTLMTSNISAYDGGADANLTITAQFGPTTVDATALALKAGMEAIRASLAESYPNSVVTGFGVSLTGFKDITL
ncbi:hypothetical protein ACWEQ3_01475 [Streptomyces mirabilis]